MAAMSLQNPEFAPNIVVTTADSKMPALTRKRSRAMTGISAKPAAAGVVTSKTEGLGMSSVEPAVIPVAAASVTSITRHPPWWTSMTLSRRSLMDDQESLDGNDNDSNSAPSLRTSLHRFSVLSSKRKSNSLLDDDDDDDNTDGSREAKHMSLATSASTLVSHDALRNSKMPRRCHSMYPATRMPAFFTNHDDKSRFRSDSTECLDGNDEDDDCITVPPPPPTFLSSASLSLSTTTQEMTVHEDDEDDIYTAAVLPRFQRSSTIRDGFDLASSIDTFRTSMLQQQQRQFFWGVSSVNKNSK